MTLLLHARLVLPGEVVDDGWLRVEDGRIVGLGGGLPPGQGQPDSSGETPGQGAAPEDASEDTVDLQGRWVVPGFVDLHVHGGGGGSYTSGNPEEAWQVRGFHRAHGTTTTLASLVTAPLDEIAKAADTLADMADDGLIAGVHLEGPFLSRARCGAQDPANLRMPRQDELARLLDAGRGTVRMVTIAPELDGGIGLVSQTVRAGAVAAIGHTDATHAEARQAIDAGARVATHLFNGMRGVHHREPGPVTAALEDDQVVVEVINDGAHLSPAVVQLVFHVAGPSRVALITDAMSAAGMGDGVYELGPMTAEVKDGIATLAGSSSLAGSTLTMDAALRRAVRELDLPLVDAVAAASTTPARVLGLDGRVGSLEPGKDADLVVLDDELRVERVMARGVWVR